MAESKAYNRRLWQPPYDSRLATEHSLDRIRFFVEGGKLENTEKNPRSTGEDQQTQLTYDRYLVEEKLAIQELIHWRAIFPEESFNVAKTTIQWMGWRYKS